MRRCRTSYLCFMGAVFMLSLYNFVSLSVLESPLPLTKSNSEHRGERQLHEAHESITDEDMEAVQFEVELEGDNPHLFQRRGVQLGDWASAEDDGAAEEIEELEGGKEETAEGGEIFWPASVELALPDGTRGPGLDSCRQFRNKFLELGLNSTEAGSWKACGRPNNAHGVLRDGTELCVRHRQPHDYYVAGDLLSYHLSLLLELVSVPCVVLERVSESERWGRPNLTALNWGSGDVVALIQWVPATARLPLPELLGEALIGGRTLFLEDVEHETMRRQVELAQWSDIVVFDFLTGQYDRIASMQDEADKQKKPELLRDRVRNMAEDGDGNLWLFDNEAGLLDGYLLMYEAVPSGNHKRFQRFQQETLSSFCVFRRGTLHAVTALYQQEDPVQYLLAFAADAEPLLGELNWREGPRLRHLRAHFRERLGALIAHWKQCQDSSTSRRESQQLLDENDQL